MPRNGTLLFSIEQWELIRRLRNSGLSKEQIGQAFDDLNKIEQDLGSMYNIPANLTQNNNLTGIPNDSNKISNNQFLNNMQLFQMAKSLTSIAQSRSSNGNGNNQNCNGINLTSLTNGNLMTKHDQTSPKIESSNEHVGNVVSSQNSSNSQSNGQSTTASTVVNNYFSSIMDPEQEAKSIDEFKSKGEVVIHGEISFFVYKHDLKQSQIARMAGVNQAYVSKFLRGEFFDLSENGKSLIYKWYLRFLKNPNIFHQAHNISINPNIISNTNGSQQLNSQDKSVGDIKSENNSSFQSFNNVTNTTYDPPKRSRFSFKSEHLVILEKAFIENQYPDQKKREELSKQCNESKPCYERVTEQIITHWFQNKRKITRKINTDDHSSISPRDEINNNIIIQEDYKGDKFNSNYEYRNDSNMSNANGDYQTDSLIDYQDLIDDDSELMLDRESSNERKRSTDSNDY